jgi:hypothetical protein
VLVPDRRSLYRAAMAGVIAGSLAWCLKPAPSVSDPPGGPGSAAAIASPVPVLALFDGPGAEVRSRANTAASGAPVIQGLSVSAGRARALVAIDGAAPVWLDRGQAVGGWTFVNLGPQGARFESQAATVVLKPFADNQSLAGHAQP